MWCSYNMQHGTCRTTQIQHGHEPVQRATHLSLCADEERPEEREPLDQRERAHVGRCALHRLGEFAHGRVSSARKHRRTHAMHARACMYAMHTRARTQYTRTHTLRTCAHARIYAAHKECPPTRSPPRSHHTRLHMHAHDSLGGARRQLHWFAVLPACARACLFALIGVSFVRSLSCLRACVARTVQLLAVSLLVCRLCVGIYAYYSQKG